MIYDIDLGGIWPAIFSVRYCEVRTSETVNRSPRFLPVNVDVEESFHKVRFSQLTFLGKIYFHFFQDKFFVPITDTVTMRVSQSWLRVVFFVRIAPCTYTHAK
jgi:hypothetical protein